MRIRLYVLGNFVSNKTSYGERETYGEHERIKKLYGKPLLERLIQSEIDNKRGQLIITSKSVCPLKRYPVLKASLASVESAMQDQIQRLVRIHPDKDVKLMHLAFRPREHRSFWSPKVPEVKFVGVV